MLPKLVFVLVAGVGVTTTGGMVPSLPPAAQVGWTRYVEATERRLHRELASAPGFLALDTVNDERSALRSGAIVVGPVTSVDETGQSIDVPHAMVHHWRGAVLLRGIGLSALLAKLESDAPDTGQEDVLRVSVID